jgi:ubiquinone/menaquinone biosynthesis C-methylase UbiE
MELYPAAVTKVFAVEPALRAHRLAEPRIERSGIPVEVVGLDAARIDLGDETCDGAVSTFTLCTIPDVASALAEVLRVLRPGGRFHLLEHGLSPDPRVAGRQRFFDPIEQRVAGGCHLTREPRSLVEDAGFVMDHVETGYAKGPKPWTWLTAATAHKP